MRRTLLAFVFLTGCFAPKVSEDDDLPGDNSSSSNGSPPAVTTAELSSSSSSTSRDTATATGGESSGSSSSSSTSGQQTSTSTGVLDCEADADCEGWEICEASSCNEPAHVVYLNFDAEGNYFYVPDLQSNAPGNQHNYQPIGSGVLVEDYGSGPKRAQVVEAVRTHLAPYRVAITEERPPSGVDFGMIVMTERPFEPQPGPGPDVSNSIGRGPTDCEDLNPRDVSFFFLNEGDSHSAGQHARFLTGAILRDTGLASVEDTEHVLHPYLLAGDGVGEIKDECSDLNSDSQTCDGMGTGCNSSTAENTHAWLVFTWGLRRA